MTTTTIRTANDFSCSFKGWFCGSRNHRIAEDALRRIGCIVLTQNESESGSQYLTLSHYGPRFDVRLRISSHALPSDRERKLRVNWLALDLRPEDLFPQSEEELLATLMVQNPDRAEELKRYAAEAERLAAKYRVRFGDTPVWQLDMKVTEEVTAEFRRLLQWETELPCRFSYREYWWNGPTGQGVGYYTSLQYENFRISSGISGIGAGTKKWWNFLLLCADNDSVRKRGLVAALEEAERRGAERPRKH
jgi:hypothetical protein